MLKAIRHTLFGGRQAATPATTDELPAEVATIIAGASVYERASNDPEWNGAPRLMVHTARGAFFADKTDAWLTAGWPNLTDAQRKQAKAMLSAHIAAWQQRAQADAAAGRGRSAWASWRP